MDHFNLLLLLLFILYKNHSSRFVPKKGVILYLLRFLSHEFHEDFIKWVISIGIISHVDQMKYNVVYTGNEKGT